MPWDKETTRKPEPILGGDQESPSDVPPEHAGGKSHSPRGVQTLWAALLGNETTPAKRTHS